MKQSSMKKKIWRLTAFFLAWTAVLSVLYRNTSGEVLLALSITFGTFTYHFIMRLLTGLVFSSVMHNKADYGKRWYRVGIREMRIYEKLKVRKWKGKMPTYDRTCFDPRVHTWDEIAQSTCQSELTHEAIVVLSFLPVAAGLRFGAYPVFIVTSVLAASFDLMLVMMQRYNRQRIARLLTRKGELDQAQAAGR